MKGRYKAISLELGLTIEICYKICSNISVWLMDFRYSEIRRIKDKVEDGISHQLKPAGIFQIR